MPLSASRSASVRRSHRRACSATLSPHIHGELLKLNIDIDDTSVTKYVGWYRFRVEWKSGRFLPP